MTTPVASKKDTVPNCETLEKTLAACGCRKFQLDAMGDHLCTCIAHSGAKKAHDWVVEKLADLRLDAIQDGFIHFQDGFIHFQLL